ncbi:hypothetical protein HFN89_05310 [Rhizobium laguerreae]|nr:hypothetical protein [Rhizobium laguerreae]
MQFGWCGLDLEPTAILVKPEPEWTPSLFDPNAYELHGISYDAARTLGEDAEVVAHKLNAALRGTAVVTDNQYWDGLWTARLADSTGVPMLFGYNDSTNMASTFRDIYDPWCLDRRGSLFEAVDRFYPHTHRADEDALRMATRTRMLIDRDWSEWLLARPAQQPVARRPFGLR